MYTKEWMEGQPGIVTSVSQDQFGNGAIRHECSVAMPVWLAMAALKHRNLLGGVPGLLLI